ncbi:T9SS type A sorting domain-containing protein [Chryseobacterium sp. FH1]|uniref:T9SS type A sorting domain-containing protein n=1 Tax=Chryseobacterium sp. FH1 TaxID=1233951 RepID=UPI0004E2BD9D|nr:T9SS type A sorting domain-containing protein [Chryseobacterium sp. FH1]KFC21679.1 hypothetical protein IO90_06895 [Chryseobacterium sp. FH1]
MKKILLSGFVAICGLMNAQAINAGFEQSEGYTVGTLAGQSIWGSTANAHTTVVSTEDAKSGIASVKMTPGTSTLAGGVISTTNYIYAPEIVLEFDFKVNAAAYQTWWMVTPQDPDAGSVVGRVVLGADIDELLVLDYTGANGALAYTEIGEIAAFTRDTWNHVKMVMNFDDGEANYYLNDVLIYTGPVVAGTSAVGNLVIANDNYDALGAAFVDNVRLYDSATAGVNDIKKSAFSVFPNPTADFLNVATKSKVESAQVYDLSGKAVNVSVSNNQIDVRNLAKGSYVVKIQTAEGTSTQKFIKK